MLAKVKNVLGLQVFGCLELRVETVIRCPGEHLPKILP